jgi:hypothetical protein
MAVGMLKNFDHHFRNPPWVRRFFGLSSTDQQVSFPTCAVGVAASPVLRDTLFGMHLSAYPFRKAPSRHASFGMSFAASARIPIFKVSSMNISASDTPPSKAPEPARPADKSPQPPDKPPPVNPSDASENTQGNEG